METLDHSSNTISYEHVSTGDVSLAKVITYVYLSEVYLKTGFLQDSEECWIKLADGSNEICISLSSSELPNGYPPPSTSPTTNLNLYNRKLSLVLLTNRWQPGSWRSLEFH